jgi:hypothetical protein
VGWWVDVGGRGEFRFRVILCAAFFPVMLHAAALRPWNRYTPILASCSRNNVHRCTQSHSTGQNINPSEHRSRKSPSIMRLKKIQMSIVQAKQTGAKQRKEAKP